MIPQNLLNNASRIAFQIDLKLLQAFRLHPTDAGHVAALLSTMDVSDGGHWVDVGSGFGEFAKLAKALRKLEFTLVNYNEFQIGHTPRDLTCVRADMHDLPFSDGVFDGAFFLYSLCHADDLTQALSEARRVVRRGGSLIVYDYTGEDSDHQRTWRELYAMFYPRSYLERISAHCGWRIEKWVYPCGEELIFNDHPAFSALRATLYKAVAV